MSLNGEKFVRRVARAWRLRHQRHNGSSCDSLELLAPHHARLLAPSPSGAAAFKFGRSIADDAACGRAGASASGAAATFLSMRVCRRSAASRARLLALSGAAAFAAAAAAPLAARPPAAAPAPPAGGGRRRSARPSAACGAAASGFTGMRRRLGRAYNFVERKLQVFNLIQLDSTFKIQSLIKMSHREGPPGCPGRTPASH
jgi:hypothetical protein